MIAPGHVLQEGVDKSRFVIHLYHNIKHEYRQMMESRNGHLAAVFRGGDDAVDAGEARGQAPGVGGGVVVMVGQDHFFGDPDAVGAQQRGEISGVSDAGDGKHVFSGQPLQIAGG